MSRSTKKTREPPEPSSVSVKSDNSADYPPNFKSTRDVLQTRKNYERRHTSDSCSVSMKSDHSAGHPLNFKRADILDESFRDSPKNIPERRHRSDSTSVSLKSDQSAGHPLNFKDGRDASETRSFPERMDTSVLSSVSLKSNRSMDYPINIKAGVDEQRTETLCDQSANQNPSELVLIFKELEKNIVKFVKSELKKFQTFLHPDPTQHLQSGKKDEEVLQGVDEDQRRSSKEAFLNITMSFLKSMKQEQLADLLYS
ncbi:hypothetical protein XENOCAPTIV_024214, partial [Xenoophorus captivus]